MHDLFCGTILVATGSGPPAEYCLPPAGPFSYGIKARCPRKSWAMPVSCPVDCWELQWTCISRPCDPEPLALQARGATPASCPAAHPLGAMARVQTPAANQTTKLHPALLPAGPPRRAVPRLRHLEDSSALQAGAAGAGPWLATGGAGLRTSRQSQRAAGAGPSRARSAESAAPAAQSSDWGPRDLPPLRPASGVLRVAGAARDRCDGQRRATLHSQMAARPDLSIRALLQRL